MGANPYSRMDSYSKAAKEAGYSARSVFKLESIDRRHRMLREGMRVLDLGCTPGSWLLYASKKVGSTGHVVGLDFSPPTSKADNIRIVLGNAFHISMEELDPEGKGFNVILSDMAPSTSGIKNIDHHKSVRLVRQAIKFAKSSLLPGGYLVCKVFQGPEVKALQQELAELAKNIRVVKPPAVRKNSTEVYLVAINWRDEFKPQILATKKRKPTPPNPPEGTTTES